MMQGTMIELEDTVPAHVMQAWKENRRVLVVVDDGIPAKVIEFIDAVAQELGDFERNGQYTTLISGYELQLANIREIGGKPIKRSHLYPIDVPIMTAVDHAGAMRKLYKRSGKNGLISYCRNKCDPKALPSILFILNRHVFND